MLPHRTAIEQNVYREGDTMTFEGEGGNVLDLRGIKDQSEGEIWQYANHGSIAQPENSQRVYGGQNETHNIVNTIVMEPSKEHGHDRGKTYLGVSDVEQEEKKKRDPALAHRFRNAIVVEDDYGDIITRYGTPQAESRQDGSPQAESRQDGIPQAESSQLEKSKISEKIRHRLSRMSNFFGKSYDGSQKMQEEQKNTGSVFDKAHMLLSRYSHATGSTESHNDEQQLGFTTNWDDHRMSKAKFNEQIQQSRVKPRTTLVDLHSKENDERDGVHLQRQHNDVVENARERVIADTTPKGFNVDGILDHQCIPWDLFPNISRLRAFSKKHFDRGDGERFTADELDLVEGLLFQLREGFTSSQHLTGLQAKQFTQLGRMKRLCLILDLIERRELLEDFIRYEIDDDVLPLPCARLQDILKRREDAIRVADHFYREQFRAASRDWSNGAHHVMHRLEALPFRPLRAIGFGSQGSIDEVQLPNSKVSCARKMWRAGANLKRITVRFDDEVKIIKKVAAHPHILELLASYTRGHEFGLLLPLADCDLWHILTMNASERKDAISNDNLLQSVGCLSSALCFMHDKGVKHKDIKPQNIVFRQGSFQFTDFGLSKDISDLSHSTTEGADRGTFKYMAPEVTEYRPHGRAADVFSLACVLFEVVSVLRGLSVDDADSFSALAPFHQNHPGIDSWIEKFVQATRGFGEDVFRFQVRLQLLFSKHPRNRPHVGDVVLYMAATPDHARLFCDRCSEDLLETS